MNIKQAYEAIAGPYDDYAAMMVEREVKVAMQRADDYGMKMLTQRQYKLAIIKHLTTLL